MHKRKRMFIIFISTWSDFNIYTCTKGKCPCKSQFTCNIQLWRGFRIQNGKSFITTGKIQWNVIIVHFINMRYYLNCVFIIISNLMYLLRDFCLRIFLFPHLDDALKLGKNLLTTAGSGKHNRHGVFFLLNYKERILSNWIHVLKF